MWKWAKLCHEEIIDIGLQRAMITLKGTTSIDLVVIWVKDKRTKEIHSIILTEACGKEKKHGN